MVASTEPAASLSGWGRTAPSRPAALRSVRTEAEVRAALAEPPARGVTARGLGRSYGDLAQNAGGLVLDMTPLASVEGPDSGGLVRAGAGCSLARIVAEALPAGWFLPVVPGTRFVTLGGAIACDVHGKNHHRDGSFGRYVEELTLATPAGDERTLNAGRTPDEFRATAGGLGLTGVILRAAVRLIPVESAWMTVDVERALDFDDTLARLEATDHRHRYSVAWVDAARGRGRFGRSVLLRGDHARAADLPPRHAAAPLALPDRRRLAVPAALARLPLPVGALAGAAFNELYWRRTREGHGGLQPLDSFFWPLDGILDWNRLYGRGGFLQYQVAVPFGAEDVLRAIMEIFAALRRPPALVVLKRFGEAAGPLSFPLPGWTVALDVALPAAGVAAALDRADELAAHAGGRIYLAKDSRLRRSRLAAMYPRLAEWREVQARFDPTQTMQSDLARRLGLHRR
ncbi:MAG: FAD-binding oxidoreductase [Gaiellaceae bacterium]